MSDLRSKGYSPEKDKINTTEKTTQNKKASPEIRASNEAAQLKNETLAKGKETLEKGKTIEDPEQIKAVITDAAATILSQIGTDKTKELANRAEKEVKSEVGKIIDKMINDKSSIFNDANPYSRTSSIVSLKVNIANRIKELHTSYNENLSSDQDLNSAKYEYLGKVIEENRHGDAIRLSIDKAEKYYRHHQELFDKAEKDIKDEFSKIIDTAIIDNSSVFKNSDPSSRASGIDNLKRDILKNLEALCIYYKDSTSSDQDLNILNAQKYTYLDKIIKERRHEDAVKLSIDKAETYYMNY